MQPRGSLATRRMSAHWVVFAAATLTTLVTAVIGAALAVFAGQALPLAVRHDLSSAPGTALSISGPVSNGQVASTAGTLRTDVRQSLHGVPFEFWSGTWSDTLDLVPGALPARPASAGKGNTPQLVAAALDGIKSHAVLVAGQWPGAPASSAPAARPASGTTGSEAADPVPAALPAAAAALLHVSPGDVLTLRDGSNHTGVRFRLTGLFVPRTLPGSAASYWSVGTIGAGGSRTLSGYTTYGPLLVSPAAFGPALTAVNGTWLAQPDMAKFTDTDLSAISGDLTTFMQAMQSSPTLGGLQLSTTLPAVLSATASNLSVARSLLVIVALQLLVLAVAALLATARLLVTQREGETALLNARGAGRWQLTRLTAAEVIPLCGLAAVIGGLAGIRLAALLATAGPLRNTGIHLPGPSLLTGSTSLAESASAAAAGSAVGTWLDAAAAALVVALVASVAILGPVLGIGPAMAEALVRRGRQAMIAVATRAGADLALVVLAFLSGWQLRRYSAASTSPDTMIDPVLALAPALALAGGTVITLRLLPVAARAGDRLAGRGRRLTGSLAVWQVSRQPLRQGGAALLLVMAVATGTLALAQHASWARSASDQASFAAGADARVDLPDPLPLGRVGAIASAVGVRNAMAASTAPNATAGTAIPGELLAVDASHAAATVRMRPDQAGTGERTLFGKITPKTPPGTVIPGRPGAIMFLAAIGLAAGTNSGTVAAELGPVAVTVTVADGSGAMYQLSAGTLPADGRDHTLTAPLGGDQASYPLRLVQIQLGYEMPLKRNAALTLTETGLPLSGWQPSATSPDFQGSLEGGNTYGPSALPSNGTWRASGDAATFSFGSGFGQDKSLVGSAPSLAPTSAQVTLSAPAESAATPLPAIATSAFADANDVGPGSVVQAFVHGAQFPVTIVAVVKTFPTVTAASGAIIANLPSVQPRLVAQGAAPLAVTEWWLGTSGHQIPAGLARALPAGTEVTGAAQTAAALTGDPVSAAPQQALLALAAAATLLAITGFWVSIASNVRRRRAETALLAALGVSQRSAALQLCLEKLMLSVPSALLGLVLGTVVARLLVPAVTLSSAATRPVPPPLTLYDLPQTLSLAAAVAVIPPLAAALVMIRRPDPAAELRAAEAA